MKPFLTTSSMLFGIAASALPAAAQDGELHRRALFGLFLEDRWDATLEIARSDARVRWWMWDGDQNTNLWVDNFVAERLKRKFGITVERVGVASPEVFMSKLKHDFETGAAAGEIDLVWINGENFKEARENDLLWGPFAQNLPNVLKYCDTNAPDIAFDFGYPTRGYETVFSRAQLVLYYDSARVKDPPRTMVQLARWIQKNPGRFTYPDVSDHTGSGFVRTVFYHTNSTGGHRAFTGQRFDRELLESTWHTTWVYLKGIEPHLWRGGSEHPASVGELDQLFQKGEVDFTISYSPFKAVAMVESKQWPDTVRPLIFDEGTVRNANFVAIPFNAKHKAAAMVLANFLVSPEFQIMSGTMMGIEHDRLKPEHVKLYDERRKSGPWAPADAELDQKSLPEPDMGYVRGIEEGWRTYVRGSK
jgi:putative spermidine/putrescine transport system substrate-binding protein